MTVAAVVVNPVCKPCEGRRKSSLYSNIHVVISFLEFTADVNCYESAQYVQLRSMRSVYSLAHK